MPNIKWKDPAYEDMLKAVVANSKSIAEVARKFGISAAGGNYRTLKHHISRLDLDVSHHTGQGWNKENYLGIENVNSNDSLKAALIRLRGRKCEVCDLSSWLGVPIPIELEHVDGTRNNEKSNLKLLCPNCHALTVTYIRKKSSLAPIAQQAEAADLKPAK